MNLSRRAVIAGLFTLPLAAASIASTPDTARADTADQLAATSAQLESLGAELSAMQASLADATSELEETGEGLIDFVKRNYGYRAERIRKAISELSGDE